MTIDRTEGLLCSVILHEEPEWPRGGSPSVSEVLDAGGHHAVMPLLDAELVASAGLASWPDRFRERCRQSALAQAAHEIVHGAEVERVVTTLREGGIPALLLKGTGLAYTVYSSPVLRPRTDTDLLVAPERAIDASRILERIGYVRIMGPAGTSVGHQTAFQRRDDRGSVHNIDLHWRISNVQSFAWLISFAELERGAIAVPALGPGAMRPCNAHALLICLLHRAATNLFERPGSGDRLIWFYDMHLLVEAMTSPEVEVFCSMVQSMACGVLTLDGLRASLARFPSPALNELIDRIAAIPQAGPSSRLLAAGKVRREWIELRAIPNTRARLVYLGERAFPSAEYMRERYSSAGRRSVAYLHARRWLASFKRFTGSPPR